MDNTELIKELKKRAVTQGDRLKLTCEQALLLSDELGVTPAAIGEACNMAQIKIRSCKLGCF